MMLHSITMMKGALTAHPIILLSMHHSLANQLSLWPDRIYSPSSTASMVPGALPSSRLFTKISARRPELRA